MVAIALHGGAGNGIHRAFSPDEMHEALTTLEFALETGRQLLHSGKSSIEAIVASICVLEDSPLFNAGRGSVLTAQGTVEMDAAIMCGATGKSGSVAGVGRLANPIQAAARVLHHPVHSFLTGSGAEEWSFSEGLSEIKPESLRTDSRVYQLEQAIRSKTLGLDHDLATGKLGTVGAVALDQHGNLAAGTSTGGMTNQSPGRVGDSPIIGAGTWASNSTCAISCTGQGEFFLRSALARDIDCRMRYLGESVQNSCQRALEENIDRKGGVGGVIALDCEGNIAMPFNTSGMFRAGFSERDKNMFVSIDPIS